MPTKNYDRKVAVVTGAARGIGYSLVQELLARDYIVVAVVRKWTDEAKLAELSPERVFPIRCDVTEPSTETVLREYLEKTVEHIDLLINNAGFSAKEKGIVGLNLQELEDVLSVQCFGPIRCVKACLPLLRKSPKAVVMNISSRFGSMALVSSESVPNEVTTYPYRIGKAAMNMFTACLAVELRTENIRVLSVHPGQVKTSFAAKGADVEPEEAAKNIVNLAENGNETACFINATGGKTLPW